MIRHIVLIKWTQNVTADDIQATSRGFAALGSSIPGVRDMTFGPDLCLMEGTYDFAMVADFDSVEDWQAYRDHPDHIAFATRFSGLAQQAARVQFEI